MRTFTIALTLTLTFTLFLLTTGCSRSKGKVAMPGLTAITPVEPEQTSEPEETTVPVEEEPTLVEAPPAEDAGAEQTFTENMMAMVEFGTLEPELAEKTPAPKVRDDVLNVSRTQTAYTYSGEVLIYAENILYLFNLEKRSWSEGPKSELKSLAALIPLPDQSALLFSTEGIQLYEFEKNSLHEIRGEKCESKLDYSNQIFFQLIGSKLLVTANNGKNSEYEIFDTERDCFEAIDEKDIERLLENDRELEIKPKRKG